MYRKKVKSMAFFSTSSSSCSSFCSPHNYMLLLINIKIAVAKPADISINKPHAFHPHHYLYEVNFMQPLQTQYILILKFQQVHIRISKRKVLILIVFPGFADLFINTVFFLLHHQQHTYSTLQA